MTLYQIRNQRQIFIDSIYAAYDVRANQSLERCNQQQHPLSASRTIRRQSGNKLTKTTTIPLIFEQISSKKKKT